MDFAGIGGLAGLGESEPPARSKGRGCLFGCLGAVLVVAAVPVVGAVVGSLRGPRTVTPEHDGLVGTWHAVGGVTITIAADGTFTAAGTRAGGDGPDSPGSELYLPPSGPGTWTIRSRHDDTAGGIDLWTPTGQIELDTKGDAAHPTLFEYIGDPDDDDEYVFTKQQ